jgi:hypothetical protein
MITIYTFVQQLKVLVYKVPVEHADKSKSHIYSDRIWYLKLYYFTLFMHFLVQLVDLVWILHKVRDTAIVSLILGFLKHFGNIWMKIE